MGLLDNIVSIATGGLGKQVIDLVTSYFPPDMKPEDKAALQLQLQEIEFKRTTEANNAANQAEQNLNDRIKSYEGTAEDLKGVPLIGPAILLLRGAFRPLFSYFVAYMDYMVFSKTWDLGQDAQMKNCFWVINLLVIGFFFGERAIQNVLPLVTQFITAKAGSK